MTRSPADESMVTKEIGFPLVGRQILLVLKEKEQLLHIHSAWVGNR